jgi:ABC-type transport system involved in cytochrome bd biosynthesis fused ATPase/permease subunit
LKKIILTAYNIEMISVGGLPIHGACVSLTLKDHRQKNIILIGDSGAGKSETLEALRQVASDYVVDMTTIFDDMGTLIIEDADGNQHVGVVVESEVVFTATDTDVRKGKVYASNNGVSVGTLEI